MIILSIIFYVFVVALAYATMSAIAIDTYYFYKEGTFKKRPAVAGLVGTALLVFIFFAFH